MVRDKQLCTSWEKKMEAKREKLLVKQYSLQLKEEKAREKEVSWTLRYPAVCAAHSTAILHISFCISWLRRRRGEGEKKT